LSSVVESDWGTNKVGGVDDWLGNLVDDWSVDSDHLLDRDVVDDLADCHFWDDLGDLWGDVSVSSYWSKNLLFGDKGLKVSSQGRSDSMDNWSSMDNWGRSSMDNCGGWGSMNNWGWGSNTSLNNFSVGNNGGWSSDLMDGGVHNGVDLLRNKLWVNNVWDCWLDDGSRISSDDGLCLVVDGLLDWNADVCDCWGHSGVNNWSGSDQWGGSNNWSWGSMDKSGSEGSG
jgi:hypothetical protein